MRKLLLIATAGLLILAGQAEAKQATAVHANDRAAPKAAQANQINGLGLIPTFLIAIGVTAWLLDQARDSTPVSP